MAANMQQQQLGTNNPTATGGPGGQARDLNSNQIEQVIEKGYGIIKVGAIDKLEKYLLTGDHNVVISNKEYMRYYT